MSLVQQIERERAAYRAARSAGDTGMAWRVLERLHILSQPRLWPHIRSPIEMLGYAIALGNRREIAGQLLRLALAPLGNLTGRLPVGNTGRANVSAFAPMDVPQDLQIILKEPVQ